MFNGLDVSSKLFLYPVKLVDSGLEPKLLASRQNKSVMDIDRSVIQRTSVRRQVKWPLRGSQWSKINIPRVFLQVSQIS